MGDAMMLRVTPSLPRRHLPLVENCREGGVHRELVLATPRQ